MGESSYPYYIAGQWRRSNAQLRVTNPYNGKIVGMTSYADAADIETAISAAESAFYETRLLSSQQRYDILMRIKSGMEQRRDELIRLVVMEVAKPIRNAEAEFERSLATVSTAGEEAKRIAGETIPLDWTPNALDRFGITKRFPIGPILGISPFNFPLNLAMHKLAPAIAAGNPIVLKPSSKAPLVMLTLAQIVDDSGLPSGAVSIIPVSTDFAEHMVGDERFKLLTFTGSADVGWRLKQSAGRKKVILELGGNAGVVVDEDAPLDYAIDRLIPGCFSYAGQSCISVQRIYVHMKIWDKFTKAFLKRVKHLKAGDPMDPSTDIGPLIDKQAVRNTAARVGEALSRGGRILIGGNADGAIYEPTVVTDVDPQARICIEEVFGPLVVIFPFTDFRAALGELDHSEYGLQAGIFTRDIEHSMLAFDQVAVGAVVINDAPTWRVDHMPYGGIKKSGMGREGLRYAIEEMTELKLMVINRSWDHSPAFNS